MSKPRTPKQPRPQVVVCGECGYRFPQDVDQADECPECGAKPAKGEQ